MHDTSDTMKWVSENSTDAVVDEIQRLRELLRRCRLHIEIACPQGAHQKLLLSDLEEFKEKFKEDSWNLEVLKEYGAWVERLDDESSALEKLMAQDPRPDEAIELKLQEMVATLEAMPAILKRIYPIEDEK